MGLAPSKLANVLFLAQIVPSRVTRARIFCAGAAQKMASEITFIICVISISICHHCLLWIWGKTLRRTSLARQKASSRHSEKFQFVCLIFSSINANNANIAIWSQLLKGAIHRINLYPVDAISSPIPIRFLDSDFSWRKRYSAFEQPGPDG